MRLPILFSALLFWISPGSAQELTFKDHGTTVKVQALAELRKNFESKRVMVWDPQEEKEILYRGLKASEILDSVYGTKWRHAEEILFTCLDGYQPSIPVANFLNDDSYFAFAREDQRDFSLISRTENNKHVDLGPFYLIWDDEKRPALKTDGSLWPFQLKTLDLINFADHFPSIAPPPSPSASVARGFLAFRKNCLICHTINGDGGAGAPELNYPVNVTEYYRENWLKTWINEPTSIRFSTLMPPLNKDILGRREMIADLISYLKAMSRKKIKPVSKNEVKK